MQAWTCSIAPMVTVESVRKTTAITGFQQEEEEEQTREDALRAAPGLEPLSLASLVALASSLVAPSTSEGSAIDAEMYIIIMVATMYHDHDHGDDDDDDHHHHHQQNGHQNYP